MPGAVFSPPPRREGRETRRPEFSDPPKGRRLISDRSRISDSEAQLFPPIAGTFRQAVARYHHHYHQHQDAVTEQGLHCALCLDKGSYCAQTL